MAEDSTTGPARRRQLGMTLPWVLVLLLAVIGIGMTLSMFARQSRRSSHWYLQSQLAHDLAMAGLREVHRQLQENNSPARLASGKAPAGMLPALRSLYQAQTLGATGQTFTLLQVPGSGAPPSVAELVEEPIASFDPYLEVTVSLLDEKPLWSAADIPEIPVNPRERAGVFQITAIASIKNQGNMRVERKVTMERGYKVVSILPSLLGRFSLFINTALPDQVLNCVPVTVEESGPGSGQGRVGGQPLTLVSPTTITTVVPGSRDMDRSRYQPASPAPDFMDRQGWVYLGNAAGGADRWVLNLAHGWGPGGESPLLPGWLRGRYGRTDQDHQLFVASLMSAIYALGFCQVDPTQRVRYDYLHHGLADNYEVVGLDSPTLGRLRGPGSTRKQLDFGSLPASALRLFGDPDRLSPTLVFGPVERRMFRKAGIWMNLVNGIPGPCKALGPYRWWPICKPGDYPQDTRSILDSVFSVPAGSNVADNYRDFGSGPLEEPFSCSLNWVLDRTQKGRYNLDGSFTPAQVPGSLPWATSRFVPALGNLPTGSCLPDPAKNALWTGDLRIDKVYSGRLSGGFKAFMGTLSARCTFALEAETFLQRFVASGKIKVPGVVYVTGSQLDLPAITEVTEGGIIVAENGIRLSGDIRGGAGGEPLTLVARAGDIEIVGGAVEAYLVSLAGQIRWPAGSFRLTGGAACHKLAVSNLRSGSGSKTIEYSGSFDPADDQKVKDSLRVQYSVDGKLAVSGGDR